MIYIPQFCQMDKISQIPKDKNANMVARGDEKILVRCSIVGDSMVGKTTTVAAFTEADHKEYSPTIFENYAGKIFFNSLPPGIFLRFDCRLLIFFFKINLFKKFFQESHQSVKEFGSRSGPIVSVYLVRNRLQKISADGTRR